MNRVISCGASALLGIAAACEAFSAAVFVTGQTPPGPTNQAVSTIGLRLSGPVVGGDARAAATYTLLDAGGDRVPGTADDRAVQVAPGYADGSNAIQLTIIGTNTLDLRSWRALDYENGASGIWTVDANGQSVFQTVNANLPTFFVSDTDFFGRQFIGRMRVENDPDDDFIGLVFGFQTNFNNGKPDSYYYLSWKRLNQVAVGSTNYGEAGFKLLRITNSAGLSVDDVRNLMWDGENGTNIHVLARLDGTNTLGWLLNTDYDFTVFYETNGAIAVSIRETTTGLVRWEANVTDPSPLGSGRIGFLNHSQRNVRYSGLSQSDALREGVYQLTARAGNPGLRGLDGTPLDGNGDGTAGDNYVSRLLIDLTPPRVNSAALQPGAIRVTYFDVGGMEPGTVSNPANYSLRSSGGDGSFGEGNEANLSARISSIVYDPASSIAILSLVPPLADEFYQLTVPAGAAIRDLAANPLQAGFQTNFLLDTTGPRVASIAPSGFIDSAVDHVDVIFDSAIQAASFTPSDAAVVGPAGAIPITGLQAVATNIFRLSFAAQGLSGTYTISIGPDVTDLAGNAMNQDGDTTNGELPDDMFAGQFVIRLPDLAVAGIGVPASAVAGQPIQVSWVITNRGLATANGPRMDSIYLSADANAGGDQLLLTVPQLAPVGPGQTQVLSATLIIPAELSGARFLVIETDSANQVNEGTAESNNVSVDNQPLQILSSDLTVLSFATPVSAQLGQAIPVSWTVQNAGTAPALASWNDRLYLSSNSNSPAGASLLGSFPSAGPLAAGSAYTQTQSVTLPLNLGLAAGNYFLLVVADASQTQPESNESNNTRARAVALTLPPLPDLIVTDILGPASALPGQVVPVSWTVTNRGAAAAVGPWIENVLLSPDNLIGGDQLLAGFSMSNTLAAGAFVRRTQNVPIPVTGASGDLRWVVVVDAALVLTEESETNNAGLGSQPVQIPAALTLSAGLSEIAEQAANPIVPAEVFRNGSLASPLLVTIASGDTNELTVPATVTIPAGQVAAGFQLVVRRDGVVDGDQLVTVTATASGLAPASLPILVRDSDVPRLFVTVPATVREGSNVLGTVTRERVTSQDLAVELRCSDSGQLTAPAVVIIPANQASAAFSVLAVDDTLIESTLSYTVTASAPGHQAGSGTLAIIDNDAVALTLRIEPREVSEGAGALAAVGTVLISGVRPHPVVIALESTATNAARTPSSVTIAPGASSATFPIAAVDDELVDGAQTATIRAFVTETATGARLGEGAADTLSVLDDDGPTLRLVLARDLVAEGLSPATTAVVSRNTPTNAPLVVNLSSSDTTEATVPASITIPSGSRSQTFEIASVNDGLTDGNQKVLITAEAAGFTRGSDTLIVSDVDLPDLVVASVTAPAAGRTDEPFNVSFRIENRGLATATGRMLQRVWLSPDAVIGDDTLLGQAEFNGSIPAGLFFAQTLPFRLPRAPGTYWIIVTTDAAEAVQEAVEDNNSAISATALQVEKSYYATVQAEVEVAPAGTAVPLHGQAFQTGSGNPAPFELVNIHIAVRGTRRIISALTGQDGRFNATFRPLPGEAGLYSVGADHPGVLETPAQDQFTLLGLRVTVPETPIRVAEGSSVSGQLRVENLSDVPLTGLAVAVVEQPGNLQATASLNTNRLPGLGETTLGFALTAVDASLQEGLVHLRITSAEGGSGDAELPVTVEALRPRLAVTPASLVAGMTRGRQTTVECQVTNLGGAATGELELLLPPVPWLTPASGTRIPSLAPGAGTTLSLLLTPPADLILGAHQGSFTIVGSNLNVTVPFNFRALSEAVGDLRIAAVDEYTYYAEGAPRVANAAVTIFDATTGQPVGGGLTDGGGQFGVTNLLEAYYRVEVRAEGHGDFRATLLVAAGRTNDVLAFLPRQTVQYFWTVVPTEIEDRTKITIETVFETVVPIPVVTIEPNVIDLDQIQGDVAQLDLKITNHGLTAANDMRLNFGTHPNWQLTPLIRDIGVLAARSSLTVPLLVRRLGPAGAGGGVYRAANAGAPCFLAAWGEWKLVCGPIVRTYTVPILVLNPGGTCPASGGGSWFPHGGGPGGAGTYTPPSAVSRPTPCDPCLFRLGEEVLKCAVDFVLPEKADCIKDLYGCATGTLSFGTAYTCFKAWYSCAKAAGKKVPPLGFLKYLECAYGLLTACEDLPGSGGGGFGPASQGLGPFHAASLAVTHPELEPLRQHTARLQKLVDVELLMFGGEVAWFQDNTGPAAANWVEAFVARTDLAGDNGASISAGERAELLNLALPQTVTAAHVNRFVDRWNRSMAYWQAGIFNQSDVPAGQSTDFLALDVLRAALAQANAAMAASEAEGFSSIVEGVEDAKQQLQQFIARSDTGGGVCARVRLRIEQEAVLTRDAFDARLEIINSTAGPLDLVDVDLEVRDPAGTAATSLFGIRPPTLSGLSGVDGTGVIGPNSTGRASWILIPTPEAAPAEPAEYRVSGTLHYRQGGVLITIPLAPASITVHPSASLTVKYFHQRDVFSDDPFTDLVEPSIPFTLGVMIQNSGRGAARNVRITSAQPQIIENEKGLLIDFEIIATEVEGQNLTPALTANFGDINPGELAIGRWLLRSSLQGLFIDYRATFEHLDGLGDQRLSLIDQVTIHELIHPVRADGAFEDGRIDFLVNDVPDLRDLPDTLHLSDGRVEPVNVVTNALADGSPTAADLRVALTASMPAGWTYLRVPEPGDGQFRLAHVLRANGTELRLSDNVWTTDRTFLGSGRRPVRENILHLLDYNSAGAYTLIYEEFSPADHAAPTSTIAPLPANSYSQIPLSWSGADETGGSGLAFFDIYVSGDGGPFLPWLQRTTLTGTAYAGAAGHSYAFYSVATDRAGNREPAPAVPDTQTSVTLSNRPPSLVTGGLVAVSEGQTAVVTNVATDPDLPANRLTFSLGPGAPAGCVIDPATGRITWATGEADGPGTNVLTVVVTDDGLPALSATGTVTIIVTESNVAPALDAIASRTLMEGSLLIFTNRASDTDLPAQNLTFSLGPGAPAGAAVQPGSGIFTWRPSEFQGPSTNVISIIVADVPGSTAASLSATQRFTVIVRDTLNDFVVAGGSTNLLSGEPGAVPFQLLSGATLTNILFLLEASAEQLTNLTLHPLAAELASASIQRLDEDRYQVLLQTRAGQPVQGSLDLASLHFETLLADHSQIVPLHISAVEGTRESGSRLSNGAGRDGRVFVVANEPLLHAMPSSNELERLIVYGLPGARYGIVTGTNLAEPTLWSLLPEVEVLGPAGSVEVVSPLHPVALYQAVEFPIAFPDRGLTLHDEGGNLRLEWPLACAGCVLEQASQWPPQADWTPVVAAPVIVGGHYSLTLPRTPAVRFYRLR